MAKTDWLLRGLVCGLMLLTAAVSGWALSSDRSAVVDVNRATVVELMTVPGMTEAWAKRIVRFRPYRRKTDLVDHGVVSPEEYKRIRDYIVAHRSMPEDSEQPASR